MSHVIESADTEIMTIGLGKGVEVDLPGGWKPLEEVLPDFEAEITRSEHADDPAWRAFRDYLSWIQVEKGRPFGGTHEAWYFQPHGTPEWRSLADSGQRVTVHGIEMSERDFFDLVDYLITNHPLSTSDDPREAFLRRVSNRGCN